MLAAANSLKNSRVLLLGGAGLVGSSISKYLCRLPTEFRPAQLIIGALTQKEALNATEDIRKRNPSTDVDMIPISGDMLVRKDLAFQRFDPTDAKARAMMLEDLHGDFLTAYKRSHLVCTLQEYRPNIVVDCINTATIIAYRNIFHATTKLQESLDGLKIGNRQDASIVDSVMEDAELAMLSQTGPKLIRHVQMLSRVAEEVGVQQYVKIGTTGTGGMGLNIPYTHSEDRPSRVLMAKTEAAFGHSGLLMLWSQTPGAPSVKELKPAAAIGYRAVDVRRVQDQYGNSSIRNYRILDLNQTNQLHLREDEFSADYSEIAPLRMAVLDMGENGVFTRDEFLTITSPDQMEMITPDEIAEQVIEELLGASTGHNVLAAMRGSLLGPGYRAGMARQNAARLLNEAAQSSDAIAPSIALGKLGPPQISKLLFEANVLLNLFGTYNNLVHANATDVAKQIAHQIKNKSSSSFLSNILHVAPSVGVPVIVEGDLLLRGAKISVPAIEGHSTTIPCPKGCELENIAEKGWVDLRAPNILVWQERAKKLMLQGSSRGQQLIPSDMAAWVLSSELEGHRDFFVHSNDSLNYSDSSEIAV